jgi:hypothetical protein
MSKKEILYAKRLSPQVMQIIFGEGFGSIVERYEINLTKIFPKAKLEIATMNFDKDGVTFDFTPYDAKLTFTASCMYELVIENK